MIRIMSWNNGASARALSQAVSNGRLIRSKASTPIPGCDILVNMGLKHVDRDWNRVGQVLNHPIRVAAASDKRRFLILAGDKAVPYFTDKARAIYDAVSTGSGLVIRHTTNGHGGEGIQIIEADDMQTASDIPDAPLYTRLINKRREYRVHMGKVREGNGTMVLDVTRKIHRNGLPIAERGHVWNHSNDYIFTRESVLQEWEDSSSIVRRIITGCSAVMQCTGLDFGAFDVVVEKGGPLSSAKLYILEVNTAPGMEGFTLQRYAEYFKYRDGGSYIRFPDALRAYMNLSTTQEEAIVSEE